MTKLQQFRQIIEDSLDRGEGIPTNKQLREAMGRDSKSTQQYGLGGRYTYEKQKIKVERGIATPADIAAFQSKLGTYEPLSEEDHQRIVVEELREAGQARWGG